MICLGDGRKREFVPGSGAGYRHIYPISQCEVRPCVLRAGLPRSLPPPACFFDISVSHSHSILATSDVLSPASAHLAPAPLTYSRRSVYPHTFPPSPCEPCAPHIDRCYSRRSSRTFGVLVLHYASHNGPIRVVPSPPPASPVSAEPSPPPTAALLAQRPAPAPLVPHAVLLPLEYPPADTCNVAPV